MYSVFWGSGLSLQIFEKPALKSLKDEVIGRKDVLKDPNELHEK